MIDAVAHDVELDASGLNCPLPLLKAKMELNRMASGAILKVIATDAGFAARLRTFADWPVIRCFVKKTEAGVYRYWLKKA